MGIDEVGGIDREKRESDGRRDIDVLRCFQMIGVGAASTSPAGLRAYRGSRPPSHRPACDPCESFRESTAAENGLNSAARLLHGAHGPTVARPIRSPNPKLGCVPRVWQCCNACRRASESVVMVSLILRGEILPEGRHGLARRSGNRARGVPRPNSSRRTWFAQGLGDWFQRQVAHAGGAAIGVHEMDMAHITGAVAEGPAPSRFLRYSCETDRPAGARCPYPRT